MIPNPNPGVADVHAGDLVYVVDDKRFKVLEAKVKAISHVNDGATVSLTFAGRDAIMGCHYSRVFRGFAEAKTAYDDAAKAEYDRIAGLVPDVPALLAYLWVHLDRRGMNDVELDALRTAAERLTGARMPESPLNAF